MNYKKYINVEDLDWFKEFKANETPRGNLKFYRTRDNLTQAQLTEKLGTTRQDVSGWRGTADQSVRKRQKSLRTFSRSLLQDSVESIT